MWSPLGKAHIKGFKKNAVKTVANRSLAVITVTANRDRDEDNRDT